MFLLQNVFVCIYLLLLLFSAAGVIVKRQFLFYSVQISILKHFISLHESVTGCFLPNEQYVNVKHAEEMAASLALS